MTSQSLADRPLIYNKDLKEIAAKLTLAPDELLFVSKNKWLEDDVQTACHNIFNAEFGNSGLFVQIDNGDTAGSKLTSLQRMLLYKRKKQLGTKHGFPDVMLIRKEKISFVEFKRIGTPSQIDIKEDQLHYQNFLQALGYKSYITNNAAYFRKVILKEFKQ